MRAKKVVPIVLRIIVTPSILALVVVQVGGLGRISAAVRGASLPLLGLGVLLTPICIGMKVWRWHLLARSIVPDITVSASLKSYLAGISLALLTPASSGEIARGLFVPTDRKTELTGLVMVDKFFDLTAVATFACLGVALVPFLPVLRSPVVRAAGVALAIAGVSSWFIFGGLAARSQPARGKGRLARLVAAFLSLRIRLIAACLAIAFTGFIFFYVQVYVVLSSFVPKPKLESFGVFPTITLSTLLPYSIGGHGPRELVAMYLLPNCKAVAGATDLRFYADRSGAPGLDAGTVLPDLRGRFADSGCPLSTNVTVSSAGQPGTWVIRDQDTRTSYIVEVESNRLRVSQDRTGASVAVAFCLHNIIVTGLPALVGVLWLGVSPTGLGRREEDERNGG